MAMEAVGEGCASPAERARIGTKRDGVNQTAVLDIHQQSMRTQKIGADSQ